jgi:hypothetical protein
MSLLSGIVKGLKKITLKKALPFIAGAAAVAIPGVGGLIAAAGVKAASSIGSAGSTVIKNASQLVQGTGIAGGALLDTGTGLLKSGTAAVGSAETALAGLKGSVNGLASQAGASFSSGAVDATVQKYLPMILLAGGALVLFLVMRK